MWFLMVEDIFPFKYDNVKFTPKQLQTRSYKLAPKSGKGENSFK
jgi:hypothetical protein